jgi:hypothetical protein
MCSLGQHFSSLADFTENHSTLKLVVCAPDLSVELLDGLGFCFCNDSRR